MEMLNWLKEYLKNTPKEQVLAEWREIESLNFEGPKAFAYLNYISIMYHTPPEEKVVLANVDSDFSESFFLCNIAK